MGGFVKHFAIVLRVKPIQIGEDAGVQSNVYK
jgi:hypothetical protein